MLTRRMLWAAAALLLTAFCLDLAMHPGGASLTQAVDDLSTTVADLAAVGACWWRACTSSGRTRRSWTLLAVACLCWAAGDGIWAYYEVVAGRDVPFPSIADVAYLTFPVLAFAGLLVRPSAVLRGQGRWRVILDAVLITASLFTLSWTTALGAVYHAGADSNLAFAVSVAYPATDLMLVAVALLVVSHAAARARLALLLLAAGLACMAVADSAFSYLTTIGNYSTGNLLDSGWLAAALLVTLAAISDRPATDEAEEQAARPTGLTVVLLPYVPAAVGLAVALFSVRNHHQNNVALCGALVIIGAVLGRQLVVLLDNRSLLSAVRRQAFTDPLTGLANRALFRDRLEHALDLHRRDLRPVALLLLDLDEFKTVNDTLGHPVGDDLLIRVAERLRGATRPGDTIARLGGDEFAVLIEDGGDALLIGARILAALETPITAEGRQLPVRASLGVAELPADSGVVTATEMLKRVDVAMYAAKRRGKAQLVAYTTELGEHDTTELELLGEFAADLAAGRLGVAYQPIYTIDGELIGFEALARWSHHGEPVSPAQFLPLAERAGLLQALDQFVLETAVAECASWAEPRPAVSVNAGTSHLAADGLPERVAELLERHGVAPHRLIIEVPEGRLLDEPAVENLRRLHGLGVRIALDDFGIGFSGLDRLRAFPLDVVKIDQTFVAAITDPQERAELIAGIIALAHGVGAYVVAEGVENPVQLERLAELGCDSVQGFLLGRPQPAPSPAALVDAARHRAQVPAPRPDAAPPLTSRS